MHTFFVFFIALIFTQVSFAEPESIRRVDQTVDGWSIIREFTDEEQKEICRTYQGKYIAHYGLVYFVENCRRRLVEWSKLPLREQAKREVVVVENEVIAAIPEGAPYLKQTTQRSCDELEGLYVTLSYSNIYLVENCRRRQFPDWETFNAHRRGRAFDKQHIIAITYQEAARLPAARPLQSTIDKELREVLTGRAGVDVIPVDEACRGVEGKNVFYYSRIYRIERCRKRQYDASQFMLKHRGVVDLVELSSEQWLSLPVGEPMEL